MPAGRMTAALHRLRGGLLRDAEGLDDGQLLERFVAGRDEAAFAAIVRRHGPMVLGVCRRLLGDAHDAEDAFQATFLVLARKAAALSRRELLANWLYGVARRTALALKRKLTRQRSREVQVQDMPQPLVNLPAPRDDRSVLLDEELSRLPEKYRIPVVLCELEGRTRREAARQLQIPEGTLSSRLATARTVLARRLRRRGAALSGGGLAALLTPDVASAAAPPAVVSATARAAAGVTAGGCPAAGLVPARVAALADEVLKVMLFTKLRAGAVALLGVLVLTAGTGLLASRPAAQAEPPPAPAPVAEAQADRPVRSLLGHTQRVTSVAYSPDGRWVATAAWDGTARIWDARTGKEVRRLDVPRSKWQDPAHLCQILFSPDNELVVVAYQAAPDEPGVLVWNRRTGEKVHEFPGGYGSVAVSPDGKLIACGGWGRGAGVNSGVVRLFELPTGKRVRELRGHQSRIDALAFSPDGKTVMAQVGIPRPPLEGGVSRMGFDPSGVRAWDVATGKERRSTLSAPGFGKQFATSPDGRTQAAGTSLYETATGGRRAELTGHTNDVCAVAFSPDGRTLASGSMDGTVRLWDVLAGKEVARFGEEVPRFAGRGWVLAVAFSPDGRTLVSGGLDKAAHLRDVSRVTGPRREPAERSPAELEADWRDLAGDAATAYAALGRLVASPESAVPFLGKQLESAKPADPERIKRLIADLDHEDFQAREQAAKELRELGDLAAPALQKALAGNPSPEASQRLAALLERLESAIPSPETARRIRAVEALESIGNPEARRLLDKLAAGPAEMRLTQEAKASAKRLAGRPSTGR